MIKIKHNQQYQITFSVCSSGCYKSHTTAKQNLMNQWVKSPAKTNSLYNSHFSVLI